MSNFLHIFVLAKLEILTAVIENSLPISYSEDGSSALRHTATELKSVTFQKTLMFILSLHSSVPLQAAPIHQLFSETENICVM